MGGGVSGTVEREGVGLRRTSAKLPSVEEVGTSTAPATALVEQRSLESHLVLSPADGGKEGVAFREVHAARLALICLSAKHLLRLIFLEEKEDAMRAMAFRSGFSQRVALSLRFLDKPLIPPGPPWPSIRSADSDVPSDTETRRGRGGGGGGGGRGGQCAVWPRLLRSRPLVCCNSLFLLFNT